MRAPLRALPIALPLAVFISFEVLFRRPGWIWPLAIILLLLCLAATWWILGPRLKTHSSRFHFLITPVLLIWSALGFSLLLESSLLRHALAAVVAIFLVLFFESLALYIWQHAAYEAFSLENLSGYANTLAVFLLVSTLSGFYVLLDVSLLTLALSSAVAIFLLSHQFLWVSKLPVAGNLVTLMVVTLLSLELLLALLMLPLHFMTAGAVFTVFWYTGMVIARASLLGMLTSKMAKRHLMLSGFLLLILLGTARWI